MAVAQRELKILEGRRERERKKPHTFVEKSRKIVAKNQNEKKGSKKTEVTF